MLKLSLQYLAFGMVSNLALSAYYKAPRIALQDEFLLLHRWALKKAHTTRLKKEALENAK